MPVKPKLNIKIVKDQASFEAMLGDMKGDISFDIETSGLYPWANKILNPSGKSWPKLGKKADPRSYDAEVKSLGFGCEKVQWIWLNELFAYTPKLLKRVHERMEECIVSGHYAKFDALWMKVHFGTAWHVDFDTGIAHYMLDENTRHGLKELAQRFFDAPDWDVDLETKQGLGDRKKYIEYHAYDLYYTRKLHQKFKRELRQDSGVHRVFHHIMMPCNRAFVDMEFEGCHIDIKRMDEVEIELKKRIAAAKKNLEKWIPISKKGDFNWGSPKQVAWLLYKKLKIECKERTKTGADSTGESALKQIDHPLVDDLFKFREAKQNLSFFIEGWKPYLVGDRLHPSFKLTGTITGRLSCENPNLQQVPRDPFIRMLLTSTPGWVLIEADLSQIELRIAAELSGDSALIQAFVQGKDPHWITALRELQRGHGEHDRVMATANKLSNKKIKDYDEAIEYLIMRGADVCVEADYAWKELRKKAKAVNFGYLYGMWWKKFIIYARDKYGVKITAEQAQESRKAFFSNWRGIEPWHKRTKQFARRNGYVLYLSGRKRRLPDAMAEEDGFRRQEAERQAVNSPVQGMANEINLMALIQIKKEFSSKVCMPIATVHDSILAYARIDHAEKIARRLMEIMKRPTLMDKFEIDMRVPLEADVKIGPWGAGVSLEKWLDANRLSAKKSKTVQKRNASRHEIKVLAA